MPAELTKPETQNSYLVQTNPLDHRNQINPSEHRNTSTVTKPHVHGRDHTHTQAPKFSA